tara:strand:- start:56 stop:220 length:165 start_codon:yes stop_codon:yes gene_type:complete
MADLGILEQIADHLADIADELRIFNQFLADIDERNGFTEPLPAAESGTQSEEGG